MDKNSYGCDGCGERLPLDNIFWFSANIGFCARCRDRLRSTADADKLETLYHRCESGDSAAAKTVIDLAQQTE